MVTGARWTELESVLVGYFGDQAVDVGAQEMVRVTAADPAYHRRYRDALIAGRRAARAGDTDVLTAVRRLAPMLPDLPAAEALLDRILDAYDAEYDRTVRG